jgi:glucose/arabinose dehydrogenase
MKMKKRLLFLMILFGVKQYLPAQNQLIVNSEHGQLLLEKVSDTIQVPYGLAFLPNGKMLVSDRPKGLIYLLDPLTKQKKSLKNLPKTDGSAFGGMMDIALHPGYPKKPWLYYNFTILEQGLYKVVLERAQLKGSSLSNRQRLFVSNHGFKQEGHVGSSIAFKDGFVYFSTGDFYELKDSAQSLSTHLGKIIRLHDDGRIPKDNPFVSQKAAMPEIWSYGHRNPQGLAFHPETLELWEHEHGPKGGDEVNRIEKGKNYGWPIICHGIDYDGQAIGAGIKEKEGLEQPAHFYVPSIAPCGIAFCNSTQFPQWKNNLFIGALALRHLNRLEIENGKMVHEERLFKEQRWRVRSVKQGPDGYLYIGTDKGCIWRVKPVKG